MNNIPKNTILNIDPNDTNRYKNSNILRQAGFVVREASTKNDAWKILKAETLQLVLLNTDNLSELEIGNQIKANPATANILIIQLCSSVTNFQQQIYGLQFEADAYINEPVEPSKLIATIKALLRMQQAQLAVQVATKEWQTTFDSMNIGVLLLDLQGNVLHCNQAFAYILKKQISEIIGRTFTELLDSSFDIFEIFPSIYKLKSICCEKTNLKIMERWFQVTIDPVVNEANTINSAVWLFSDITSQKCSQEKAQKYQEYLEIKLAESNKELINVNQQLQQEIIKRRRVEKENTQLLIKEQQARHQAERANLVKDEFLAMVSHELRSPLTAILGWAKLLKNHQLDSATTAIAIDTIERNASIENQLIDNLLDLKNIQQGNLSLNVVPINLASLIGSVIDTAWFVAEAKSIEIQASISEVVHVAGDLQRLKQVIWNLLANAIKFTPPAGKIDIKLERQGDYAQIQVCDTGIGINADFLPQVFDYFCQSDSSKTRKYAGLGLGLAIARYLVELQGGTISCFSLGEGTGATFTVKLPITNTTVQIEQLLKLEKQTSANY